MYQCQTAGYLQSDNETMQIDNDNHNFATLMSNNMDDIAIDIDTFIDVDVLDVDPVNRLDIKSFNMKLRQEVWNNYFGQECESGKCFICKGYINRDMASTYIFRCAYYISCKDGGSPKPNNFKPVCQLCYTNLNGKSLSEMMQLQSQSQSQNNTNIFSFGNNYRFSNQHNNQFHNIPKFSFDANTNETSNMWKNQTFSADEMMNVDN